MSSLASSAPQNGQARGFHDNHADYHTPDGNGRALAPEGVNVAAGSAGSIPLAKSDAKSKKSNWLEDAMGTVAKVFQGDKDPTLTRSAGGSAAEDESRDLGGPSNLSATATATANNTEAVDAADYEEFLEEEGMEGDTTTPSMMVAKLIQEQAGVEAQKQFMEVFLRQTVTPQLTALQNELQSQVERNKADQAAFQAVLLVEAHLEVAPLTTISESFDDALFQFRVNPTEFGHKTGHQAHLLALARTMSRGATRNSQRLTSTKSAHVSPRAARQQSPHTRDRAYLVNPTEFGHKTGHQAHLGSYSLWRAQ